MYGEWSDSLKAKFSEADPYGKLTLLETPSLYVIFPKTRERLSSKKNENKNQLINDRVLPEPTNFNLLKKSKVQNF